MSFFPLWSSSPVCQPPGSRTLRSDSTDLSWSQYIVTGHHTLYFSHLNSRKNLLKPQSDLSATGKASHRLKPRSILHVYYMCITWKKYYLIWIIYLDCNDLFGIPETLLNNLLRWTRTFSVAVLDSQDVQLNVSEHLVPKIAPGNRSWNFSV